MIGYPSEYQTEDEFCNEMTYWDCLNLIDTAEERYLQEIRHRSCQLADANVTVKPTEMHFVCMHEIAHAAVQYYWHRKEVWDRTLCTMTDEAITAMYSHSLDDLKPDTSGAIYYELPIDSKE